MLLDGARDKVEAPPTTSTLEDADGDGIANEIPTSIVDYMEFYLLNYFKPATYAQTPELAAAHNGAPSLRHQACCLTAPGIRSKHRLPPPLWRTLMETVLRMKFRRALSITWSSIC